MKRNLEITTYNHKGVNVTVKIDYGQRTISLVEQNGYGPKKWLFADRQIEYMAGWQNIFDAMKFAVNEAEKLLEEQIDEERRELTEKANGFFNELSKVGNKAFPLKSGKKIAKKK